MLLVARSIRSSSRFSSPFRSRGRSFLRSFLLFPRYACLAWIAIIHFTCLTLTTRESFRTRTFSRRTAYSAVEARRNARGFVAAKTQTRDLRPSRTAQKSRRHFRVNQPDLPSSMMLRNGSWDLSCADSPSEKKKKA